MVKDPTFSKYMAACISIVRISNVGSYIVWDELITGDGGLNAAEYFQIYLHPYCFIKLVNNI